MTLRHYAFILAVILALLCPAALSAIQPVSCWHRDDDWRSWPAENVSVAPGGIFQFTTEGRNSVSSLPCSTVRRLRAPSVPPPKVIGDYTCFSPDGDLTVYEGTMTSFGMVNGAMMITDWYTGVEITTTLPCLVRLDMVTNR